ncbi:response regulator transcription factor [Paramagnetospirillum kuznetsovii]|uniref:response regulator transcription factor n=1 Tax=Paramagnetospirillum kuznetsovii TaxID=2053833 RepID=UPI001374D527|nr:response regulator [Paramagnetospirillum kuznetsovii]
MPPCWNAGINGQHTITLPRGAMSRILIVEDTKLMRDSLVDVLEAAGHLAVTADNGALAVEMVEGGASFDVIVTDIIMPEMDGIQTILELQTMLPAARIIAISGGSARLEKTQGLETAQRLGAVAVLEKPFEVDAFLAAVEAALKG